MPYIPIYGPGRTFFVSVHVGDIGRIPHLSFAAILVGHDGREAAFGIQKDLLCSKSEYFMRYFDEIDRKSDGDGDKIEYMVKLPDVSPGIFGYVQRFLYDKEVWPDTDAELPTFDDLVSVWQFGQKYEVDGLCEKAIEAMVDLKEQTSQIPGASLISKAWAETPEGSPVRELFLQWSQEFFRLAEDGASTFAASLPQGFLGALVVRMTASPAPSTHGTSTQSPAIGTGAAFASVASSSRKNVNHRDDDDNEDSNNHADARPQKKARKSTGSMAMGPPAPVQRTLAAASSSNSSPAANRRATLPLVPKKSNAGRRASGLASADTVFSDEQKMLFCNDLLSRMLSGPGFWTRLVKPFKYPVDPSNDGVPDYFDKVKNPMDLMTIQNKMNAGEYSGPEAFATDVQLIIDNCKAYWKKNSTLYVHAEKFEKSFKEKFAEMHKWLSKLTGPELA